jgi:hypothetical protein
VSEPIHPDPEPEDSLEEESEQLRLVDSLDDFGEWMEHLPADEQYRSRRWWMGEL